MRRIMGLIIILVLTLTGCKGGLLLVDTHPELNRTFRLGIDIPNWALDKVGYGVGQLSPEQFATQEGGILLNYPEPDDVNVKRSQNIFNQMLPPDAFYKACEWRNRFEEI